MGSQATKVQDVMSRTVRACRPTDSLERAAQIMWDADIGCLPVLDEQLRPVAMITDRDVAMAAHFQRTRLRDIPVSTVMSRHVVRCQMDTDLNELQYLMQIAQVRRVPVVLPTGEIAGIVTLTDLVRAPDGRERQALPGIVRTVSEISTPRHPVPQAAE